MDPATGLPDPIPCYLTPAHDPARNNARGGRTQDPYATDFHHCPLTTRPHLYDPPRLLMEGGRATVLAAWVYCVPFSASWEFRSLFYFLQTLSPNFLFGFGGQRKPRIFVSNTQGVLRSHMNFRVSFSTSAKNDLGVYIKFNWVCQSLWLVLPS